MIGFPILHERKQHLYSLTHCSGSWIKRKELLVKLETGLGARGGDCGKSQLIFRCHSVTYKFLLWHGS